MSEKNLTPLDKLIFLTDEMERISNPFMWRDENGQLCITNSDERRAQAKANREFIDSINERLEAHEWNECFDLLNDELPVLINKTREYLN